MLNECSTDMEDKRFFEKCYQPERVEGFKKSRRFYMYLPIPFHISIEHSTK
jgi:hypothetical protein